MLKTDVISVSVKTLIDKNWQVVVCKNFVEIDHSRSTLINISRN